jgi:hypothetical protein
MINVPGNTNWIAIGAAANTASTIFTATGAGSGTGYGQALNSVAVSGIAAPFNFTGFSANLDYVNIVGSDLTANTNNAATFTGSVNSSAQGNRPRSVNFNP